eukprot:Gb_39665 [translate_table: standard]
MGNGSSNRRRHTNPPAPSSQYASSPYPLHGPPHGSYVFAANAPYPVPYPHADPYPPHAYHPQHYYHHAPPYSNTGSASMVAPVVSRQNYPQNNGGWSYGMRPPPWPVAPPPPPPQSPPPYVEHQKATTIRNDVNLKKETLRLERDEENPDRFLVAFTFDSMVSGSISIFFFAKEGSNCSLTALKPHICMPVREPFEKGLGQKFRQPSGTGIDLSLFDDADLVKEGPDEVFPLVIRAEASSMSRMADGYAASQQIGSPLPKLVNSQITQAVLEKKDSGEYHVRVVKQILWVDGIRYELQEIYGIGNSAGTDFDGNDPGKECVICMSEPRDTTVLPCRHMCMCSECAKVLRFQTNRCPICRRPVERLMEIKVNKAEE